MEAKSSKSSSEKEGYKVFLNNLPLNIQEEEIQEHISKLLNHPVEVRKGRNKGEKNKRNVILTLPSLELQEELLAIPLIQI